MPFLKDVSDYLNSLVKIILLLNFPVVQITPANLRIKLSTIKYKSIKTSYSLLKGSKSVIISLPTNELNKGKIRRSFMPNLIHSLDAANIHLLIKKINKDKEEINSIYTIHDCFATTANEMKN